MSELELTDFTCRGCGRKLVGVEVPGAPLLILDGPGGPDVFDCPGCGRSRIDLNGDHLGAWSVALFAKLAARPPEGQSGGHAPAEVPPEVAAVVIARMVSHTRRLKAAAAEADPPAPWWFDV